MLCSGESDHGESMFYIHFIFRTVLLARLGLDEQLSFLDFGHASFMTKCSVNILFRRFWSILLTLINIVHPGQFRRP